MEYAAYKTNTGAHNDMQLNDGTRTGQQKRNIIVMAELIRIIISDIYAAYLKQILQ